MNSNHFPRHHRHTVVSRAPLLALAVTVCMLVSACVEDQPSARSSEPGGRLTATATSTAVDAPDYPPASMCGSRSLRGPVKAPRGAVSVPVSHSLPKLVSRHPAGTTFWLAPGTHSLRLGQYEQVIPKRRDVFIGAAGAIIDGQHSNLYAFGGKAAGVVISHLTVQNFGSRGDNNNEGVVNHDAGHNWTINHNTIRHNAGAGILLGSGARVSNNCLARNGQYGLSSYEARGVHRILVRHNEIAWNNTDDWEKRQKGCGCTGGGKFWDTRGAAVLNNWVHHNHGPGLWADTNDRQFLFRGNYLSDNDGQGLFYETSYNAAIVHNTFVGNGIVDGPENPTFPTAAIYLSESGSDPRAGGTYGQHFNVTGNKFVDNWAGVIAWENADRFAGSPANTSTGYTTRVNESATVAACGTPSLIKQEPYIDDCRWKTKNVRISRNLFVFRPDWIGPSCTVAAGCGFMGLFSNYGTYPSWSPYQAYLVPNNVTFRQHNRWEKNKYVGPWRFMGRTLNNKISWAMWRGTRFRQDAGSVRK